MPIAFFHQPYAQVPTFLVPQNAMNCRISRAFLRIFTDFLRIFTTFSPFLAHTCAYGRAESPFLTKKQT